MDVTTCFGLSTDITTLSGDIPSTTGACDSILEIVITQGVVDDVVCGDWTGTTLQNDGLVLLEYSGGTTTLNVHSECCQVIDSNYIPEIGEEGFYVCRWRAFHDKISLYTRS